MKFSVLREKTSSLEEGPMIHRDENSTTNHTKKSYNRARCLRFTKVTFYVVMILFIGWLFAEYMGFDEVPRMFGTHMFSKNNQLDDDEQIIRARDFLRRTMQDEREEWRKTADNEINPEPFIRHGTHYVKPKFQKSDSSEEKTDSNQDIQASTTLPFVEIEESATVKSINVGKDNDQSDTSEDKMITDKDLETSTWALVKSEESSTMKSINIERDSDESDSTKEKIISPEYSTMSTLPLPKIAESSTVSMSDEKDNAESDPPKDNIVSDEHTEASRVVDDSILFLDWFDFTNDSEYDDSYEDDYSNNW